MHTKKPYMKKIYIFSLFVLITIFAIADIMEEDGKAGKTGSPGENNCTGCHTSFNVNSGLGSITISSPTLAPDWEYMTDSVYQIDVTVEQTGSPLFGFGFEALRTSNNTNGGSFILTNTLETQLKVANINGSNRTNVVHKQNGGLTNDSHTFSFNWKAPSTNVGNIMFYAVGNATDNQGDSLGDYVYTMTQLVTPFTTGISESSSNEPVSIFPNPAHDFITISTSRISSAMVYQLIDCNGRVVLNESRKDIKTNAPVKIKLPEDLINGIYFLKVMGENNNTVAGKVFVYN